MSTSSTPTTEANATPTEITLNGESYTMSPLGISDLAMLEREMKNSAIELAKEAVNRMSPALANGVLSDAVARASRLSINGADGQQYMSSMEGMTRMVWLSLKHNHPQITLKQVVGLLDQPGAMDVAMEAFDTISGDAAGDTGNSHAGQTTAST